MTTFAVVARVAEASLEPVIVPNLGSANMIADGPAMVLGKFLSGKAEREYLE